VPLNPPNYYELLGISENFTCDQINGLRKIFAKRFHPDTGTEPDGPRFARINDAIDILSDPDKRPTYDRDLEDARAQARERDQAEKARAEAARRKAERAPGPTAGDAFADAMAGQRSREPRGGPAPTAGGRTGPGPPGSPRPSAASPTPPRSASSGRGRTNPYYWLGALALIGAVAGIALGSGGQHHTLAGTRTATGISGAPEMPSYSCGQYDFNTLGHDYSPGNPAIETAVQGTSYHLSLIKTQYQTSGRDDIYVLARFGMAAQIRWCRVISSYADVEVGSGGDATVAGHGRYVYYEAPSDNGARCRVRLFIRARDGVAHYRIDGETGGVLTHHCSRADFVNHGYEAATLARHPE
jgi:DnaJ-like protein